MSNNEYLSLKIEAQLKDDFYNFCKRSGISASAAVNQLAVKSFETDSIPFVIKALNYDLKRDGNSKRISVRMKPELRQGFSEICTKKGIPMSTVIKIFMMQCIELGRFPFN